MKKILLALFIFAFTTQVNAAQILITKFDFELSGGVNVYDQMATNLAAVGHTVDVVDVRTAGTLATTLAATSYDQVFLFDLTSTTYLNATDNSALSNFWGTHQGLVVDTRSYGYFFQGNNASEIALIQNVASNLDASGGGVWIGTDHNPEWTNNSNPFLAEIGVDTITGSFSDPVNFADPASVLLSGVTATDLWGGGQSVGQAPIGLQPNGIEMFIHFGHTRNDGSILPYISASFPLEGVDPDPDPVDVSEPFTLALFSVGLIGLSFIRRQRII